MGKKSVAKKPKKKNFNTYTSKTKLKKEITADVFEQLARTVYPIAEKEALMKLIVCALEAASLEFGFGKQRLARLAGRIVDQYDCIIGGYVTLDDLSADIEKLCGLRFEMTEEDKEEMYEAQKLLGGAINGNN